MFCHLEHRIDVTHHAWGSTLETVHLGLVFPSLSSLCVCGAVTLGQIVSGFFEPQVRAVGNGWPEMVMIAVARQLTSLKRIVKTLHV